MALARERTLGPPPQAAVATVIRWALAVQAAHVLEHVAQATQRYVLMMQRAHGFPGAIFDLEWVHCAYNTGLEAAFLAAFLLWRRADRPGVSPFLTVLVWAQGYHVVEHVIKMVQYYALGITESPKGILGFVIPLIWLHFAFNFAVLVLLVLTWEHVRDRRLSTASAA